LPVDSKGANSTKHFSHNPTEHGDLNNTENKLQNVDQCNEYQHTCNIDKVEEENSLNRAKANRVSKTVSKVVLLTGIQEEESCEISKDEDSDRLSDECMVTISNGIIEQIDNSINLDKSNEIRPKVPTTFRHFVSPNNFTDEEKEKLYLGDAPQSRHGIEISQVKLK